MGTAASRPGPPCRCRPVSATPDGTRRPHRRAPRVDRHRAASGPPGASPDRGSQPPGSPADPPRTRAVCRRSVQAASSRTVSSARARASGSCCRGQRGHDLAEQPDLALRGGPERAQVARLQPELGQPAGGCGHHQGVRVVPAAAPLLDQPVLFQRRHRRLGHPGLGAAAPPGRAGRRRGRPGPRWAGSGRLTPGPGAAVNPCARPGPWPPRRPMRARGPARRAGRGSPAAAGSGRAARSARTAAGPRPTS